jgi:predicted nucleic acid-binding Zn ribbon protein
VSSERDHRDRRSQGDWDQYRDGRDHGNHPSIKGGPTPPVSGPAAAPVDVPVDVPVDAPPDAPPDAASDGGATTPAWDPAGVDLARAVAASFGATARVRGMRTPGTGGRSTRGRDRARDRSARSGAAPDDRDPQLLDNTIDRLVNDRGWTTDVAVAGAIARWDQIVGPDVAAHCRAERYADTELTVRADSTAWATQVRLLAPSLVKRLNEELGDNTVSRVTVLGPTAPTWRRGPRSARDGRGPRDTYG